MAQPPMFYFSKALSHRQKVLRLYKKASRLVDSYYLPDVLEARYEKVIVRARFDRQKNEQDERKAQQILIDGVREVWDKRHPQILQFAGDPEGVAFERQLVYPDALLDAWSAQEKSLYPEYFARREIMRKELLASFDKMMEEREDKVRKDIGLEN